jgi:hypothetical protein
MLYTNGNDGPNPMCFIDTPEVENNGFYSQKHTTPHTSGVHGEDSGINLDVDILKEILCLEKPQKIVNAQQGSASLLQRKLN